MKTLKQLVKEYGENAKVLLVEMADDYNYIFDDYKLSKKIKNNILDNVRNDLVDPYMSGGEEISDKIYKELSENAEEGI